MLAAGDISLKHSFTLQLRWHKLRLKLVAKSLVCLKSLKMQLLRKVLFPTRQYTKASGFDRLGRGINNLLFLQIVPFNNSFCKMLFYC